MEGNMFTFLMDIKIKYYILIASTINPLIWAVILNKN